MRAHAAAALMLAVIVSPALAETKTYDVASFTGVDVTSGVAAVVEVGPEQSVRAEAATAAALERLEVDVRDGVLSVRIDQNLLEGLFTLFRGPDITVYVTVPSLISAVASAGSNVDVKGMSGAELRLDASAGAALVATEMAGEQIEANASAGARVSASGACNALTADASAGATLVAFDLPCASVTVDASAGAHASVFASAEIDASASAGATIDVRGRPRPGSVESSAGGSVNFIE